MNHTANRISRTVAVAIAGAAVGLATTFAVASGSDQDPGSHHQQQRAAIARWADENHMSGLSPASLTSSAVSQYGWTPQMAEETRAITEYAREHDLSGLSPASLQPGDD